LKPQKVECFQKILWPLIMSFFTFQIVFFRQKKIFHFLICFCRQKEKSSCKSTGAIWICRGIKKVFIICLSKKKFKIRNYDSVLLNCFFTIGYNSQLKIEQTRNVFCCYFNFLVFAAKKEKNSCLLTFFYIPEKNCSLNNQRTLKLQFRWVFLSLFISVYLVQPVIRTLLGTSVFVSKPDEWLDEFGESFDFLQSTIHYNTNKQVALMF
jgi:hypothetical protein